ncbi:alpha/beta-hydrolase [Dacryopinax primogenitus]|uniref:Alpha/beta-hydrolase n=1 Tax=Dacryopinax primogenitus (strain DJM 731) TaxID=1858805 RepID=M5FN80_DACPD|nr:alpha/beta-hydrolase [Dacryopinax primogenitus]EJT96980.1 alpha/beta-hydrolase [Dacryopinax primogenitus]
MDRSQPISLQHKLAAVASLAYAKLILLAYWIISNLLPSWRHNPKWTLRRAVGFRLSGWAVSEFSPKFQDLCTRDIKIEPGDDELRRWNVGFSRTGLMDSPLTGEIGRLEKEAAIKRVKVGMYWHGPADEQGRHDYGAQEGERVMLFLHGGKYLVGTAHPSDMTSYIPMQLCNFSRTVKRIVAVEYRLSSMASKLSVHPFPTALIDAICSFRYLLQLGFHSNNIFIVGDSAGGNLALGLTRYLVEEEQRSLAGLILLSPWCDMTTSHSQPGMSRQRNYVKDVLGPAINPDSYAVKAFLGGLSPESPYISPSCKWIQPSFGGFPRTYLVAGEMEVFLDEIKTLKSRMEGFVERGLTYDETPAAPHDFCTISLMEPERSQLLARVAEWVDDADRPIAEEYLIYI